MARTTSKRLAPRPHERLVELLRGTGWRRTALLRRTAAGLLAALALVLALIPHERGSPIVVAARDLRSGTALSDADLAVASWPAGMLPAGALGALAQADGRVLVGAARAGEPLTDVRLAGPDTMARLTGRAGDAAVPVRLPDPDVARLLAPGSRVDIVTPGSDDGRPVMLAADAAVITVLAAEPDGPGQAARGRLVLVALPRSDAARVAAAALSEQVAVTLR
ncbi:MAG: pilus assembly protein CpaB [Pseudonocardiales bacterium]|jgi:Flp pilus assembly protein CpaB|nr:pilus assembly protein CpaB [Pseudonocardiales bacterium]